MSIALTTLAPPQLARIRLFKESDSARPWRCYVDGELLRSVTGQVRHFRNAAGALEAGAFEVRERIRWSWRPRCDLCNVQVSTWLSSSSWPLVFDRWRREQRRCHACALARRAA